MKFCLLAQQADGGRATWADEFQGELHPPHEWVDQFGTERLAENWASDFMDQAAAPDVASGLGDQEYQFSPNNPFLAVCCTPALFLMMRAHVLLRRRTTCWVILLHVKQYCKFAVAKTSYLHFEGCSAKLKQAVRGSAE